MRNVVVVGGVGVGVVVVVVAAAVVVVVAVASLLPLLVCSILFGLSLS